MTKIYLYVFWSKNDLNDYIENKLYGPLLWIKAQTTPFGYAIDFEGIDKFYEKITGENKGVVSGKERSGLSDKKGLYIKGREKVYAIVRAKKEGRFEKDICFREYPKIEKFFEI